MAYTLSQLEDTAKRLWVSSYSGVPGIVCITTNIPGPVVGITVCTHGNEPAGLAAARFLLDWIDDGGKLTCGTVYIVLNNLEASKKYFSSTTSKERRLARFIDINLNRLTKDLPVQGNNVYELKRVRELLPIWSQFEIGLDIHSTTQKDGEMIVNLGNTLHAELIRGFPLSRIVSNIDHVQIGYPATYFYGGGARSAKTLAIECGAHKSPDSFDRAIACTRSLLQNLHMFPGLTEAVLSEYEEYFVTKSIFFPDFSYKLTRLFKNFEFIPKGTVLAKGNGSDIINDHDGHTLFAAKTMPDRLDEEILFLTLPKKISKIA